MGQILKTLKQRIEELLARRNQPAQTTAKGTPAPADITEARYYVRLLVNRQVRGPLPARQLVCYPKFCLDTFVCSEKRNHRQRRNWVHARTLPVFQEAARHADKTAFLPKSESQRKEERKKAFVVWLDQRRHFRLLLAGLIGLTIFWQFPKPSWLGGPKRRPQRPVSADPSQAPAPKASEVKSVDLSSLPMDVNDQFGAARPHSTVLSARQESPNAGKAASNGAMPSAQPAPAVQPAPAAATAKTDAWTTPAGNAPSSDANGRKTDAPGAFSPKPQANAPASGSENAAVNPGATPRTPAGIPGLSSRQGVSTILGRRVGAGFEAHLRPPTFRSKGPGRGIVSAGQSGGDGGSGGGGSGRHTSSAGGGHITSLPQNPSERNRGGGGDSGGPTDKDVGSAASQVRHMADDNKGISNAPSVDAAKNLGDSQWGGRKTDDTAPDAPSDNAVVTPPTAPEVETPEELLADAEATRQQTPAKDFTPWAEWQELFEQLSTLAGILLMLCAIEGFLGDVTPPPWNVALKTCAFGLATAVVAIGTAMIAIGAVVASLGAGPILGGLDAFFGGLFVTSAALAMAGLMEIGSKVATKIATMSVDLIFHVADYLHDPSDQPTQGVDGVSTAFDLFDCFV